jgi:hypothetical protein
MHDIRIHYRPDNYPHWTLWREFIDEFEMIGKPGEIDAGGTPSVRAGSLRVFPWETRNNCDPTLAGRRGYDFQIKFSGGSHIVY